MSDANPTVLRATLAALGEVQRGKREGVALGHAEVCALLVHVQELRREVGRVTALVEAERAEGNKRMRKMVQKWVARGEKLLEEMP